MNHLPEEEEYQDSQDTIKSEVKCESNSNEATLLLLSWCRSCLLLDNRKTDVLKLND